MDLFKDLLPALDKCDLEAIKRMTPEDFKKNAPFVAMKFMSASRSKTTAPYHLMAVNEVVNKRFWQLGDYKDLQMMLIALCGTGSNQYHYFPGKIPGEGKIYKFVRECYPLWKEDEIEMFLKISTIDDLEQLAKDQGMQDKELKDFKKELKKLDG